MSRCDSCKYPYDIRKWPCDDCLQGDRYEPKPHTNADFIRTMTDEALADFLYSTWKEQDTFSKDVCKKCPDTNCQPKCWLNWLKEENE